MKLTYANKVALNENAEISDINKVTDSDMNEIKAVVNNNDDDMTTISTNLTNATTYSTTETVVGKWIGGKPIYKKTIVNNPTTYGEQVRIDLNISNPDLVWVDKSNSFLISNGGATFCGIGADGNQEYWFDVRQIAPSKEYLYCTVGESIYSNSTIYVTINYTKTTD